jgi:hypothetical protein
MPFLQLGWKLERGGSTSLSFDWQTKETRVARKEECTESSAEALACLGVRLFFFYITFTCTRWSILQQCMLPWTETWYSVPGCISLQWTRRYILSHWTGLCQQKKNQLQCYSKEVKTSIAPVDTVILYSKCSPRPLGDPRQMGSWALIHASRSF